MPRVGRTLFTRQRIAERVAELAREIERDYAGESLILLPILKGSFIFAADLARCLRLPVRIEFLGVQSYGDMTRSSGVVQITQDLTHPIAGQHVLIVEDIVDTGLTAHYLLEQLQARHPKTVRLCALLYKPSSAERPVDVAYTGFSVGDVFVVGYGLDYAQEYRNLPDLVVLELDD